MTIEELEKEHNFSDPAEQPAKEIIIKVIGVGGGGCNAVTHMYKKGVAHVTYALANTDKQQLNHSPVPSRVLLGPKTTKGLGAGNVPDVAREAAEESVAEINQLFDDDTRMVFITAGMGGGTGTGASPVVARVARERGLLTVGIVTLPFLFEGDAKMIKAINGAREIGKYVDSLLIINNEILAEQFGDLTLLNAFQKADDTLDNAASSIAELITSEGYINLDFNDVSTTLTNGRAAIISTGYAEGEGRVRAAIEDALRSPLLREKDIFTSKKILFNLFYNPNSSNPVMMSEIADFQSFTKGIPGLDVIYGVSFDESLGEKVKVSILAAGFDTKLINAVSRPTASTLGDDIEVLESDETDNRIPQISDEDMRLLSAAYGADKIAELRQNRNAQNFVILTPEQMEDDIVIELLENTPAFNRDQVHAEAIRTGKPIISTNSGSGGLSFAPKASGRIGVKKPAAQATNDDDDDFGIISFIN
ncbi:MAG: cell division protein FtsZ [Muribaculaceae bacterium]|nr:cell division protein FtsZ [Muribaculaceae bacterium]